MSESDNPSSPKQEEEKDVSENGDADKSKEESEQNDSKTEEHAKKEESEEEDDDEEPPLGLLERPVELTSGKREKKKVERLEIAAKLSGSERKKVDIPEGKGTKLGDCPRVEQKLNQIKAVNLKPMHRLLYNRLAPNSEIKRNIRQFNGFTFQKGDKEFEKRLTALNKMTIPNLKQMCDVLDVERGKTKVEFVEHIMDFLMKPSSSGLKLAEKKKRKPKGSADTEKKGAKRKRAPKKKESKGKAKKDDLSDLSDSEDNVDEEEEEEEEEEEKEEKSKSASEDEEEEEEEPPKKKPKTEKKAPKKEPAKKESPKAKKQNGKSEKAAKTEKKETKKKVVDSDSDSDDEPLAPATKKNEPPTNSDLKDDIKKILEGANLEEVTMKTVVKQVYEKYPSFDLTDRKDFIKSTVREIIS